MNARRETLPGQMHIQRHEKYSAFSAVAQPGFGGGGTWVWGTEVPQRGPGAEPLVGGSGGIASRKLIAVIMDIWLPNHAQLCVFSSTAQPGIFL